MSRRLTGRSRLRCENLEDRAVPATLYVDDSFQVTADTAPSGQSAGDMVTFAPGEPGETTGLTFGTDAFSTVQAAVAAATAGDTIQVARGLYTLSTGITVNKSLTILGPQAGVDARPSAGTTRVIGSANEAIIDVNGLSQGFVIAASNITIDGFDIRNSTTLIDSTGTTAYTNAQIRNNIIHNSSIGGGSKGIELNAVTDSVIEFNNIFTVFHSGIELGATSAGASTGGTVRFNEVHDLGSGGTSNAAIYAFAVGSTATTINATIQGNLVYNHFGNDAIRIGASGTTDRNLDGGSIIDNVVDNVAQDGIVVQARNTVVRRNEVSRSFSSNGAIYLQEATGATVENNSVHDNGASVAAILIGTGSGTSPANNVVRFNSIVNNTNNLIRFRDVTGGTATLDASANWFGSAAQATVAASVVSTAGASATTNRIDFTPWLNNGTDSDAGTPGFQPNFLGLTVAPSTVSLQTGGGGRIQEAIDLAAVGATVDVINATYTEDVNLNKDVTVNLAGTVSGKVSGTDGAYVATGTLSLGDGTPTGVSFSSDFSIGSQSVSLSDGTGADLDGTTTLTGGAVSVGSTRIGGTLTGTGAVGPSSVNVKSGGAVSPGVGPGAGFFTMRIASFQAGSAFTVDLNGTTAGTSYDQVVITNQTGSALFLGGAMLNVNFGYTPAVGDSFTIFDRQDATATATTFGGINGVAGTLNNNDVVTVGGYQLRINYDGGDGNDLTLTVVDDIDPTVTISAPSVSFADGAATVTYTITYTDANFAQSTLTAADVSLNGTPTADVSVDAGTGATRTVTLTNFTGDGPLGISLAANTAQDTSGNLAPAAGPSATFTVDTTDPSVLISAPSLSFANGAATVTYTITYTDANFAQSTLTAADVTLNGTPTADVSVDAGTGATRTVTLTNFTGDGPLGISLAANTAQDAAGNTAPTAGPSATFTVDTTDPSVMIGAPSATFANGSATVTYTITYTDANFAQSTLTAADVALNGAGVSAAVSVDAGTGSTRTVTLTNFTGDGPLGISLAASTAQDAAGNQAPTAGPSATFTVDTTDPVVTGVTSTTADGTYGVGASINVTVTFSEAVTLSGGNLTVTLDTGATVTITPFSNATSASGTYTVAVGQNSPDLDSASPLTLAGGATLRDAAGNDATLTIPAGQSLDDLKALVVDTAAPAVQSITRANTSPTNATSVDFTVTFSEGVTGVDTSDFTLTAPGLSGAGVTNVSGSGTTYTVTVSTGTGDGTVRLDLSDDDSVADGAGNELGGMGAGNGDFTTGQVYAVDKSGPAVMISAPSASFANGAATVTFTITYTDPLFAQSTLTAADVTLNGAPGAAVSVDVGTGATRTVTLTNFTGNGPLGISLAANTAQDSVGNVSLAAGPSATLTVDTLSPSVSVGAPSSTLVNGAATVTYTVTYADANFGSSTLTAADVSLNTTGTATATVSVDSGTGTTRTVTLTGITGNGTIGISLAGGTAVDLAGNLAAAAGPSATFTADTAGPAVTIGSPVAGANSTTYSYTVTYADPNFDHSTLTAADVSLVTTGSTTATVSVDSGTGPTRTVTLTNVTGQGTIAIRLAAGTAVDAVGNQAPAAGPAAAVVLALPGLFPDTAVAGSNSGVVTVYHPDGTVAYTVTPFPGLTGVRPVVAEVTGDRTADLLVGTGPGSRGRVAVVDGTAGTVARTLTPFEDSFTGGVFLAAADLNGDGFAEVAVSPDEGGGGRVTVFDGRTGSVVANFFGIEDANFRGGARVAFGDLNGDGTPDLFVAAGEGGGPRVAVYDGRTLVPGQSPTRLINDFFVFEQTLRNGVYLAAGDVDSDGRDDLVLGGGPGGAPRVLVLSGQVLFAAGPAAALADPAANFFAGDSSNRDGVRVTTKNLDGDAFADIVTGLGSGGRVSGYLGADFDGAGAPEEFGIDAVPGSTGGVFVG